MTTPTCPGATNDSSPVATSVEHALPLRYRRRHRKRGVALIMVLGAITIMTVMLTELQDETSAELNQALTYRDQVKAEYAARSAVNLTRLLIASEPMIRQALLPIFMAFPIMKPPKQIPVWNFAEKILGAFNGEGGQENFGRFASVNLAEGKNLGLDGASFSIKVVDEDGKLNVNQASRGSTFARERLGSQLLGMMTGPQNDPLFSERDADGNFHTRQQICSAIVDWSDPDQDAFPCDPQASQQNVAAGAEDGYYQLLRRPYRRKNAAYDSLEELHLVRGIDEDFWATFVEADPDKPEDRTMTVWGSGKLNVNSAPALTLLGALCNPRSTNVLESPGCSPEGIPAFLSNMALLRMVSFGLPIFSSVGNFIKTVQGQGNSPLSSFLNPGSGATGDPLADATSGDGGASAASNPPLFKFKSESLLKDELTTKSAVFSIYATGVVTQGQRRTTVRFHTVVDFRAAPPPQVSLALQAQRQLAGGAGTAPPDSSSQPAPKLPAGATEEALAGFFQPDPGGTIIFHRME